MKNKHTAPSKAKNVGAANNPAPLANLPANNVTDRTVSLGTTHNSQFAKKGSMPSSAANGTLTPQRAAPATSSKPNMPANNVNNKMPSMGTTHHGVGEVPGYLKGRN